MGEGERDFFFGLFFHIFFLTTFGPHHFWPRPPLGPLFYQTVLCPNPCEPTWANGAALRDNLLLMSCFWGHGPPCEGPPLPMDLPARDPLLCCVVCRCCCCCCVVFWCGVCVQNFRGCVQNLGALPTPSAGPPSAGPPKISPFFPSPATISILSSSLGSHFAEFWWCLKRRCQLCTFGLTGCRVKPQFLLQNVKNNFTIDLPPPSPEDFRKSQ